MPKARHPALWPLGGLLLITLCVVMKFLASRSIVRPPATAPGGQKQPAKATSAAPPATPPPVSESPAAAELGQRLTQANDPAGCLQTLDQLLFLYRRALGENPVGQNEDIVTALLGDNAKRTAFLPPNSPAIRDGKLIDPWGSPYWFHPISAHQMEIRSAGPDRDLFTSDDLKP